MRHAKILLSLLVLAACGREPAPETGTAKSATAPAAAAPQAVTITAIDFSYEVPSTPIISGLTNLTLANAGKELHQLEVSRLPEGKTLADFSTALQSERRVPAWATSVGGPNVVLPGAQGTTTLELEPGLYAIYCLIPSPDGTSHIAKGMIGSFEVQAGNAPSAPVPVGDIQMVLSNYGFTLSPPPRAGKHTFTVTNTATQNHEAVLLRLPSGSSIEPFKAWVSGGMKGIPPAEPFGGITEISPGRTIDFTADFAPGTYGIVCVVPDADDGQPHLFHGMFATFTVS